MKAVLQEYKNVDFEKLLKTYFERLQALRRCL
jgi:hypothetical protein